MPSGFIQPAPDSRPSVPEGGYTCRRPCRTDTRSDRQCDGAGRAGPNPNSPGILSSGTERRASYQRANPLPQRLTMYEIAPIRVRPGRGSVWEYQKLEVALAVGRPELAARPLMAAL